MKTKSLKQTIKESYGAIALSETNATCCQSSSCCSMSSDNLSMYESYQNINGYQQEADLFLGCGLPTEIAQIKEGDVVLDLGSGAGNDAFIARTIVGERGSVIGIDMTPEMIKRAQLNNQKIGYKNVEFILGEIEDMHAIPSNHIDVAISNCVMNLIPNKIKAFHEIHRVLKTGGHFSISDIVYQGSLPTEILHVAEMHVGCVAGASEKSSYLGIIKSLGFKNIQIKKERMIQLPDDLLMQFLSPESLQQFKKSNAGIYSITVYAEKNDEGICCNSNDQGCCTTTESQTLKTSESLCCATHIESSDTCCK